MSAESGLFGGQLTTLMNKATMTGPAVVTVQIIAATIAVLVIVLIVDNFFPFLPINPVSGPSAAARAGKTFWKSIDGDTQNLIVPASQSPTKLPATYTMSVQLVLADSRTPDLGHFRHILHRGSNPCKLSVTAAGSTGHANIQPSDIPDDDPAYKAAGLPQIMNPGVFLDKYKNDIHIFVHTQGTEDGVAALWLESMTIEDVPLNVPITLGIVCNGQALEVYWNCNLYSTMLLRGVPYMPKADNQWFGRYCAFASAGVVKNLQLWPTALNLGDYRQMCSVASSVNASEMPSLPSASCPAPRKS
jgi:hypothetical protein